MENNIENEFENIVIENLTNNSSIEENTSENSVIAENTVIEETENVVLVDENSITIQELHYDLTFIISILIFFIVVILFKYAYKFFNIFF